MQNRLLWTVCASVILAGCGNESQPVGPTPLPSARVDVSNESTWEDWTPYFYPSGCSNWAYQALSYRVHLRMQIKTFEDGREVIVQHLNIAGGKLLDALGNIVHFTQKADFQLDALPDGSYTASSTVRFKLKGPGIDEDFELELLIRWDGLNTTIESTAIVDCK